MRSTRTLVAIFAASLACFPAGAAAQLPNADAEAQAQAERENAITDRYLTAVPVEMAAAVDTRTAAVGQEVSARVLDTATLADGAVLPHGTRLLGHVIQTRGSGAEQGNSILILAFDRAEVKPGQSVRVRCVIQAVGKTGAKLAGPSGMSSAEPGRRRGAASSPSTGGVGGDAGDIPGLNPDGSAAPSGLPTAASQRPGIGRQTSDLSLPQPGSGTTKVAEAGESVSGTPHATGLAGVLLWAVPTASGALTAVGRDISLQPGTEMTLGVIAR